MIVLPFNITKKTTTNCLTQTIDHSEISDFMKNPSNYPKTICITNK